MAAFAFSFAIDADQKLESVQINSDKLALESDCEEPLMKRAKAVTRDCPIGCPVEKPLEESEPEIFKENKQSVCQAEQFSTVVTSKEEHSEYGTELISKEDKRSECPARPYEELSWADMIEECLHDTEIESIDCSSSNDESSEIRLFSLNPSLIETRILSLNEDSRPDDSVSEAATRGSDLVPRVYEGGLKIWECSLDLVKFLHDNIARLFADEDAVRRLKVLELGCGAGLPGIWALRHAGVARVHFQDYNRQVVLGFTMTNVVVNEKDDDEDAGKYRDSCRFHCGDWSDMVKRVDDKFDLILASETIYCLDDLRKFHDAVAHFLRPEGGVALVAAKEYYFGVGGGIDAYLDVVKNSEKPLKSKVIWINQHGVRRGIIELRY